MMDGKKPYLVVILIQSIYAVTYILSKAAFNGGMNCFVFTFYRQAIATVFLVPVAVIFERKRAPSLSFMAFCKIFMLSLFGITLSLNLYGIGLVYTSATLLVATTNTLPVITILLAVLLRMETVKLRTFSGKAKVVGIILCMAGCASLAIYKGPYLKPLINTHLLEHHNNEEDLSVSHTTRTWVIGCFLLLLANIAWALRLVFQDRILRDYPSKLLFTTLTCILGCIQSLVVAFCIERNPSQWQLHWDVGLLAVAYSGIVVTGVAYYLQTWCIEKKGPVFMAMSNPVSLIITTFSSYFLLGELISLGSVLGEILLVGGFYSVLWAKSKEQTDDNKDFTIEEGKDCLKVEEAT
ncbi:PREDICTED: WAT1-related protein At5g64700-like [Nelumbo nucifera]|uniref:WAT1-related protein n=2 Tax=Nelumbo nucifera TaxID=4432 RepID=A0A822Z9C5_NELNU|nr:PREDICTED: WAT1-related protein At5g64700-like [Nelumbo nucifera]DAD40055.1 TPA_asm: hypothetical protein HUJ06_014378 [Nelumbo nucifera]